MPQNLTDDKSTLVQVMAWCRQATSHNLTQCWPRSLTPYGITRPQWVKENRSYDKGLISMIQFLMVRGFITWWTQALSHSAFGLSQWETLLHCNSVPHWLSLYPELSLPVSMLCIITGIQHASIEKIESRLYKHNKILHQNQLIPQKNTCHLNKYFSFRVLFVNAPS